jgi:Tfp pilus assembly protein PilE
MHKEGDILDGKYRITGKIGGGAYGTVYKAYDISRPHQKLALKEIEEGSIRPGERDETRQLFIREAAILKSLSHENLPRVLDSFSLIDRATLDESHYLVMAFISGQNLDQVLKKRGKPLIPAEVIAWARQVGDILKYLHGHDPHPVIFRDLKPSNLILDDEKKIWLVDFGIARYFNPSKIKDTFQMGTPGFSAPEQYGSGQSDQRSDIYSFGVTFFHLLTNEDVLQYNLRFPPLRSIAPGVPEWFARVIMKCLAVNPGERYQSSLDLVADLEKEGMASSPAPPPVNIAAPPAPAQKTPLKLTAGLMLLLGGLAMSLLIAALGSPFGVFLFIILATIGIQSLAKSLGCTMTLIEFFIILAIIAILAAITVPGFMRARQQGQWAACRSNLKKLSTAVELYAEDNRKQLPESLVDLVPRYMTSLPMCPAARQFRYRYTCNQRADNYTIYCCGNAHRPVAADDRPRFSKLKGFE